MDLFLVADILGCLWPVDTIDLLLATVRELLLGSAVAIDLFLATELLLGSAVVMDLFVTILLARF